MPQGEADPFAGAQRRRRGPQCRCRCRQRRMDSLFGCRRYVAAGKARTPGRADRRRYQSGVLRVGGVHGRWPSHGRYLSRPAGAGRGVRVEGFASAQLHRHSNRVGAARLAAARRFRRKSAGRGGPGSVDPSGAGGCPGLCAANLGRSVCPAALVITLPRQRSQPSCAADDPPPCRTATASGRSPRRAMPTPVIPRWRMAMSFGPPAFSAARWRQATGLRHRSVRPRGAGSQARGRDCAKSCC